jgi:cytochrome bd-type quinol oxidase subunit 1
MAFRNIVILSDHSLNMTGHGHMSKRRVRHNTSNRYVLFMVPLPAAIIIVGWHVATEYTIEGRI